MRKAFNFYNSYYQVYKSLNDKQKVEFMDCMLQVQFLEEKMENISFTDKMVGLLWTTQRHSIISQIAGYAHKKGIKTEDIGDLYATTEGGRQGGTEGGCLQKSKGKRKDKSKGSITPLRSVQTDDMFNLWFEETWADYRTHILQFRKQYGSKSKTYELLSRVVNKLRTIHKWESEEIMLHWFRVYYIDEQESGKFTKNMDKWGFDDIEDYIADIGKEVNDV